MRHLDACWAFCFAAALPMPAQQSQDPARLVAQLAGSERATVHQQLVALSGKAVPALIDALGTDDKTVLIEVAGILREIGADAADAVEGLKGALARAEVEGAAEILWTLGELGPYRAADVSLDPQTLTRDLLRHQLRGGPGELETHWAMQRLRIRVEFPVDLDLVALIATAQGLQAYRVELAVELLGRRGPAAETALPALQEVLNRPDPRLLTTERTVPLRAKAARAILAITSHGPAAKRARSVLAGHAAAPAARATMPERARSRIAELIRELDDGSGCQAAAANLTAFGTPAVPALAEALLMDHEAGFRELALTVLRELGPRAVAAVPQLVDLLLLLPTEHSVSLLRTLASVAPWSRDVVPPFFFSGSVGDVAIFRRRIPGNADAEFLTEFGEAFQAYDASMAVDPTCTLSELEARLVGQIVLRREVALAVLLERGAGARPLLPALAVVLEQEQPKHYVNVWIDASSGRHEPRDRTAIVHCLAAQAILAIAAPDDPLVAKAKQVLARSEGK